MLYWDIASALLFCPLLLMYIVKEPTEARKRALAYDIALIKKIVKEYTASAVKKALADIAGATADYSALPEYESGKFTLTADRLIKFAQKNGTGDFAKYKAFTFRGGKLIPVEGTIRLMFRLLLM